MIVQHVKLLEQYFNKPIKDIGLGISEAVLLSKGNQVYESILRGYIGTLMGTDSSFYYKPKECLKLTPVDKSTDLQLSCSGEISSEISGKILQSGGFKWTERGYWFLPYSRWQYIITSSFLSKAHTLGIDCWPLPTPDTKPNLTGNTSFEIIHRITDMPSMKQVLIYSDHPFRFFVFVSNKHSVNFPEISWRHNPHFGAYETVSIGAVLQLINELHERDFYIYSDIPATSIHDRIKQNWDSLSHKIKLVS